MKYLNKLLVLAMAGTIGMGSSGLIASARNIGCLDNYTVYYSQDTLTEPVQKTSSKQESIVYSTKMEDV